MGTLIRLKDEGKIRAIGVGNVTLARLKEFQAIGPVDSDQEEYHMLDRDLEAELMPFCRTNNIAVLAYSVLAQGLLTGAIPIDRQFPPGDLRRTYARFSPESRKKVAALLESIGPMARAHGVPVSHVAIAWAIAPGRATHALIGARNPKQATENALAGNLELTPNEVSLIDQQIQTYASDIPHLW
jgi:aryl-alcohol dehydrogenase-like predicted oxidoreductase